MKQLYFPLSLSFPLLILLFQCSKTLVHAQAAAPAPAGPTDVTKILEKAGGFTTLIHLLQTTQVGDRINSWLSDSGQSLTLLAPTDEAFSTLKSGTLNSLTDERKTALILFHVLPTYLPMSQFQTVSNPVRTQAGDNTYYQFPLNVTTSGNSVNISTGINKASVGGTVYTDNQLAVYQVDHVLLPMNIFGPQPPAPPPAPPKPRKKAEAPVAALPVGSSDAVGGAIAALGIAILVVFSL
ncbi:hypothetical protein CDL12_00521 [Handroanthus impetiginosus]|uniref:FAS1 domain-containing protein n=1 Tax=Handroanthus impetiginosus TaxID=429701 RepID=A0A2G9HD20_9LAMI|nr:hypothetical protein CDL12_11924 [Handroanthus impetiginosus]PIN26711.1 hypothetical protein CDL12_00521 [Handroanthus impetiginosus]